MAPRPPSKSPIVPKRGPVGPTSRPAEAGAATGPSGTAGQGLDGLIGETPSGIPTTGPAVKRPVQPPALPTVGFTPDITEAILNLSQESRKAQLRRQGIEIPGEGPTPIKPIVPTQEVKRVVEGKPKEGWFDRFVGWGFNVDVLGKMPITGWDLPGSFRPGTAIVAPVLQNVIRPSLGAWQTFGRGVVSAVFEEIPEALMELRGGAQKYTAYDYIPVHPQTGIPIAKVGDPVITNLDVVLGTSIPDIDNIINQEDLIAAQQKVIDEKKRTTEASWDDMWNATKDFTFSASDVSYIPDTGNKYIDGVIDTAIDILYDPTTYATLGGSAVIAPILEVGATAGTKAAVKAAAREAAEVAVREATERAAVVLADPAATAASKAAVKAAVKAAEEAAKKATQEAISAAPRRLYGRGAREALANTILESRNNAFRVLDDPTASAAEKALADDALRVLTEEFVADVAAKGYSVIKGEAAKILGTRSGVRIGLPATKKVFVPTTAKISQLFGTALATPKYMFFRTPIGGMMLKRVTPKTGTELFSQADLLLMRNALRTGKLGKKELNPALANDFVQLLKMNRIHKSVYSSSAKRFQIGYQKIQKALKKTKIDSRYFMIPRTEWASAGLAPLSFEQSKIYDNIIDNVLIPLDNELKQVLKDTLDIDMVPRTAASGFFPRVQSDKAVEWAMNNAEDVTRLSQAMGVDRTFFLGNFDDAKFGAGKYFFGQRLTGTETIEELNAIARAYGLDFDWFETDFLKALPRYMDDQARITAYSQAIYNQIVSNQARGASPLRSAGTIPSSVVQGKPSVSTIGTIEDIVRDFLTADKFERGWSKVEIDEILNSLDSIASRMTAAGDINADDFIREVANFRDRVTDIDALVSQRVIDGTAATLLRAEAIDQARLIQDSLGKVTREFAVSNPDRWKSVVKLVDDGFTALNAKIMPDIQVREQVAELFQNVQRLEDGDFIKLAEKALKDINTTFKSYAVLSPAFHVRNTFSNFMMLLAAGANPVNLSRATNIYFRFQNYLRKGGDIEGFLDDLISKGIIKPEETIMTAEALESMLETGFGQFEEIALEAGIGRVGVFGRPTTGKLPILPRIPKVRNIPGVSREFKTLGRLSSYPGRVIYGSRKVGEFIEGWNRFQLTFDGLMQGYPIDDALARTRKYLVDYNDLASADRAIKLLQPFWIWASRNVPLQIEIMWMNPKAYVAYNKIRQNFEDRENRNPYLNQYRTLAGAWKLPQQTPLSGGIIGTLAGAALGGITGGPIGAGIGGLAGAGIGATQLTSPDAYLQPDFGFPGAGTPSLLETATTNPLQLLAGLTPVIRQPIEALANKNFFTGGPIAEEGSPEEIEERRRYALRGFFPPSIAAQRNAPIIDLLPGQPTQSEWAQNWLGTKPSDDFNLWARSTGLPIFQLLPEDVKREINRRRFELEALREDELLKLRELQEARINEIREGNLPPTGGPATTTTVPTAPGTGRGLDGLIGE